jgi:hypothetical protein
MTESNPVLVHNHIRKWVETIVIGHNLCPFAAATWAETKIAVSSAQNLNDLLLDLGAEIDALMSTASDLLATTLLVVPDWLQDFTDYLDVLEVIHQCLEDLDLMDEFQVASFHPQYLFADQDVDDPAHGTNRSPWPVFHLLREASVAEAVALHPDPEGIPERNAEKFRNMGGRRVTQMLASIQGDGTSQ